MQLHAIIQTLLWCTSIVCAKVTYSGDKSQLLLSLEQTPDYVDLKGPLHRQRIAVIGGGIAGASAAYFLGEKRHPGTDGPVIVVFEQESEFGGRVASTGLHNRTSEAVDTGAAYLSSEDWCILSSASGVGLTPLPYLGTSYGQPPQRTAVWDGNRLHNSSLSKDWYPRTWPDYLRSLWNYGYSAHKAKRLINSAQKRYASFGHRSIRNLTRSLHEAELLPEATTSALDYFSDAFGVDSKLLNDALIPRIRAKLSADLDEVTALAALNVLAPTELLHINGGNWRLINRLLRLSEARIMTSTRVTGLKQATTGGWLVEYDVSADCDHPVSESFDYVIVATDIRSSKMLISPSDPEPSISESGDYKSRRHVTFFSSELRISAKAFDEVPGTPMPDKVFTNAQGAGEFGLYSIEIPTRVAPAGHGDEIIESEYLYRLVSRHPVPDVEIARLLGQDLDEGSSLPSIGVTWLYRRDWNRTFEPFMGGRLLEDLHFADGLYYTAASERVLSSMELSCRMGRNVAESFLDDHMPRRSSR